MNPQIYPLMPELFTQYELMILDFNQIPEDFPEYKNIHEFFEKSMNSGIDPKLPENRQKFNNQFLASVNKRYLVSRYAEDRIEMLKGSRIAQEGRTLHLGIDIFSKDLESVFAPCEGVIVLTGEEEGSHGFGNYIIFKPDSEITENYIFLGHLSKDLPAFGKVKKGQEIARLGDFVNNENGGWSRHLHVQLLKDLPEGKSLPIGYSSRDALADNMIKYPDPTFLVSPNKPL